MLYAFRVGKICNVLSRFPKAFHADVTQLLYTVGDEINNRSVPWKTNSSKMFRGKTDVRRGFTGFGTKKSIKIYLWCGHS